MTLVSEIITDALRETNIIALGASPSAAESAEALRRLQNLVSSVFGNELGDKLTDLPLGQGSTRPSGYPWYGNTLPADLVIPQNARLVLNLSAASTVYLHPYPQDGARLAVIDAGKTLDTYTLTLNGNGRLIEAATTLALSTESLAREWFYRADVGDWRRISNLTLAGMFPFPPEFDDMFITMLAMRLNPRYGQTLAGESLAAFNRSRGQFRSRYKQIIEQDSELALTSMTAQQTRWYNRNWALAASSRFNTGRP